MLNVSIMDQKRVIFDGIASRVILPGDYGEFEVLPFHKPIISLLKKGEILVDETNFPIERGIVRFNKDQLVALVEI